MATNFVYDGDVVPVLESLLTHPTHSPDYVESGDPVLVGSLTGVALTSAAAAGLGISYEALTGNLSEVNFSSARMGAHEMGRNIDACYKNAGA